MSTTGQSSAQPPQCFIGLYGLNRSLRWTWRSIDRSFIAPLRACGIEPKIVCHFHVPKQITSIRSGEFGSAANDSGYQNLPVSAIVQEDQKVDILPSDVIPLTEPTFEGDTQETAQSRRNLLFQLRSLKRLWQIMAEEGAGQSDLFFFVRPDLEYLDPLDADDVVPRLGTGTPEIFTAEWQEWGGLNDRFAFCNWRAGEVYANRIDHAATYAENHQGLKAETLLQEVVTAAGLAHDHTEMRGMRVRADGFTLRENFDLGQTRRIAMALRNRSIKFRRKLRRLLS